MHELQSFLGKIKDVPVLIAGDLMLDTFVYGNVDRISPEGPIPVLSVEKETRMLGGAGNVLSNLSALGAKPVLLSVIGDDAQGLLVRDMAEAMGADCAGLVSDPSRPTILKTRYVAQGQQLLRTDFEKTHAIDPSLEEKILQTAQEKIKSVKAVVLSDYGKGFFKGTLLAQLIALANRAGIPVLVDPKGDDFSIYRGADIVTPNRKELALATKTQNLKSDEEIVGAAQRVIAHCGIKHVVATRSEDGMSVIGEGGDVLHLRTTAREVYDVSGAGDTVMATIAACLAAGMELQSAARLANLAGGIAVSKSGTAPVGMQELKSALSDNRQNISSLATWNDAANKIKSWQEQGLVVGMTGGCFDILHYGHVTYLNDARAKCDRLVVALNHDASIRLLKGPSRPVNDEVARSEVMGALVSVDMVVLFGAETAGADNTPCALLDAVRPDIFFKGGDYTVESLPETKTVQGYGGQVQIMPVYQGYSTTGIIEKARELG